MTNTLTDPLLLAGKLLANVAKWLMAAGAAIAVLCIPFLIFMRDDINANLRTEIGDPTLVFPLWQAVAAVALAAIAVALMFVFFDRLARIIGTVSEGDPFVPANAERLSQMGWVMLAVQVLAIPLAGLGLFVAKTLEDQGGTIDAGIDLSGILMVILLFILARVFKRGAEMRADLEGTV